MKIKTRDLIGLALNWAVAKANGWLTYPTDSIERGEWYHTNAAVAPRGYEHNRIHILDYCPSTDWSDGGPVIDRELSKVFKNVGGTFSAQIRHEADHPLVAHKVLAGWTNSSGPTYLIAAMRCYVESKLGEEVEIPDELLT